MRFNTILALTIALFFSATVSAQTATTQPTTQPTAVEETTPTTLPTTEPVVKAPMEEYRLAIDPALLPGTSFKVAGEKLNEKRAQQAIGKPRKLTLLEGLAWIPRVVFYPVHLVLEYGVRWPLEQVTEWVERANVIPKVQNATQFDGGNGRIAPRFLLHSEFAVGLGLSINWDNMFIEGNDWGIGGDIGFNRNASFDFGTRIRFWDDLAKFGLSYNLERRNDFVFYGIGPDTFDIDETNFFRAKNTGIASLDFSRFPSGLGAKTSFELADYKFECSGDEEDDLCGPDHAPNTGDDLILIDNPNFANFFTDGYTLLRFKGLLFWDSRPERPAPGTGIRLEAFGRVGQGVGSSDAIQFTRYGGEAAFFWDIYRYRVLGFRMRAELAEPVGDGQIPFGELITLGGLEEMRGFEQARFHGRSSLVATLDYRYPIWSFIDANIFFEVGNVFEPQFEELSLKKMRPSVGLSLKTIASRYTSLDLTIAVGGTRFDAQPVKVDSVKFSFGTNWGF